MRYRLIVFMLFVVTVSSVLAQDTATFTAEDYDIALEDNWTTKAQLTLPVTLDAPVPLVILVHGSGPYDMDSTYFTTSIEEPLSANFRLLAETLPQAGIAVLRYNKRGVNALGDYDAAQVQASYNLDTLVSDAAGVLAFAQTLDAVDPQRILFYGWSEGTWVITNLATQQPDAVAGLIMQGAANGDLSQALTFQWLENALPYLQETTDADGDGELSLPEILAIPDGPVGYMASTVLRDPTSTPQKPVINSYVDANKDGSLNIAEEVQVTLETFVANYAAYLPKITSSYDTADLASALDLPILILHGDTDGWTPESMSQAIADSAPDATLKTYVGLGHALSPSESFNTDAFGVTDEAPIADLSAWLDAQQ